MNSFPANSSYSFHRMRLNLGVQLDHEVVQLILFRGYNNQILIVITISKVNSDITWFPDNSSVWILYTTFLAVISL